MAEQNVHRARLSELVAARIKGYIIDHSLVEGDRLPTEAQMAELFGVSRISIREATKALSFLGIIQAAPRRGLTVGHVDMARVTEYLGFHFALSNYPPEQLLKTRLVIELGALDEAMNRISGDDQAFAALTAINDRLDKARTSDEFIASDVDFHRKLVETSGIGPLVAFNGLIEVFFRRFRQQVLSVIQVRRLRAGGARGHRQLLAALRKKDVSKARHLLQAHLAHYKREGEKP